MIALSVSGSATDPISHITTHPVVVVVVVVVVVWATLFKKV